MKRRLIIVGAVLAALAGLLGLRRALAVDPRDRLADGAGSWWFPRGGPYILGFESPGPAELLVDGGRVARGQGRVLERIVYSRGAHAVVFHAPPGARLLWHPPGRRGAPEYVPASSLAPEPPAAAHFGAGAGASRTDAAIATAMLLVVLAGGLALARPRPQRKTAGILAAVFAIALVPRILAAGAVGQTWDEDEYWSSGRNYVENVLALDFREASWTWNYQHPPVTKYIAGLGALWADGYGPARALFVLLGAGACALAAAVGCRLFGPRAGLFGGIACALTPHLIAHSGIVGHETPSLFLWTLAVYLALLARDGAGPGRAVWAGIAVGLALATRFSNAFLAPLVAILLVVRPPRRALLAVTYAGAAAALTFFLVWPRMWSHPVNHLAEAWAVLQQQHLPESYLGRQVLTPPWHYFPVYFAATAPAGLLAVALVGAGLRLARRRERAWLYLAAWLILPFGVGLSPVRQDGVRYILPALVPLALAAGAAVDALRARLAGAALGIYLAVVCARIHPYYLDYYGEQVGGPARVARLHLFETGWWGEGIAEAVRYINRNAAPGATVCRLAQPTHITWFRADLWTHLCERPDAAVRADWLLVNDAGVPGYEPPPGAELVHDVRAQGASLVRVYRVSASPASP